MHKCANKKCKTQHVRLILFLSTYCFLFQTQTTLGLYFRPGSPCFLPGSVRNDTSTALPAACCVLGACRSATVWIVARVTVGVPWFARVRTAVGC